MMKVPPTVAVIIIATGALLWACGEDDDVPTPTNTEEPAAEATPTAGPTPGPNEQGQAPFFWRTEDNFESLRANERYKALFRITSGYAEDELSIVAVHRESAAEVVIESRLSEPMGEDEPGSYYPTFIELPEAGVWDITVTAGDDSTTIEVTAAEPDA